MTAPGPGRAATPDELSGELQDLVTATVEDLVARHLPDWRIPGTFGGHPVEPDVAADLAFTLAHLHDLGLEEVAATPLPDALRLVLAQVDGRRTHTFFSYRVAETLARFGDLRHSSLLEGWSDAARDELAVAVDSTDWIELLDLGLPRNYSAVLARCELARRRLGLPVDDSVLDDLVRRTRDLLERDRYLDDSSHGVGRTDIYTADVWLFTEPLAPLLGDLWTDGVARAVDLVDRVGSPDGAAVPWGRSTGALATALTVELAALVLAHRNRHPEWSDRPERWSGRGAAAGRAMRGWFQDGLTTAHRHRSPYGYRGPFRRLQMTLDLLGKLAWAAVALRSAPGVPGSVPTRLLHPDRDELLALSGTSTAAVWTRQARGFGFVVPFVGATRSDYLAAPRRPGLFEVPVDSAIACWVPLVAARHRTWAPCGLPAAVERSGRGASGVRARWEGLAALGELDPPADHPSLPGSAELEYRLRGRELTLSVALELEEPPDGCTVVIPEVAGRPLRVEASGPGGAPMDRVDTSGVAEWRSFWSELPTVHQVDLDPARTMRVEVRVTPVPRVATADHGHHYDRCLYGPLEAARRAVSRPSPLGPLGDPSADLAEVDLFHLHWPEWLAFDDLDEHRRIAEELADRGLPVLWTAHNLTPHEKRPEVHDPIYQLWADRAAAVIHHSVWGEERMRSRYRFGGATRHVVIPHGHFGDLYPTSGTPRDEAASHLGLPDAEVRIAVLGAPRAERDVVGFLRAVAASSNPSIQVCCWSLAGVDAAPDDPRIVVAEPYRMVDAATYGLRLAACDAVALPFGDGGDMLGTGVAADVIGCGRAALASSWGYLAEVLGEAAVPVGDTVEAMTAALDGLTADAVAAAQAAARARRPQQSWERSAELTAALIDDLLIDDLLTGDLLTGDRMGA